MYSLPLRLLGGEQVHLTAYSYKNRNKTPCLKNAGAALSWGNPFDPALPQSDPPGSRGLHENLVGWDDPQEAALLELYLSAGEREAKAILDPEG